MNKKGRKVKIKHKKSQERVKGKVRKAKAAAKRVGCQGGAKKARDAEALDRALARLNEAYERSRTP